MVSRRHLLKLSALGTASFAAPLAYSASNITMTHNTGNPIGSTSPKDLSDNARNLDYLCLGPSHSYLDRKGVPRKSWTGMEGEFSADQVRRESVFDAGQANRETQFNTFMDASGYEPPSPYAAGLALERTTQTVTHLGSEYRVKSQFLPLVTTDWATDEPKFKLIGDDSLRQEAADSVDPSKGVGMFGFAGGTAALEFYRARSLQDGGKVALSAHRGLSRVAPENTIASFEMAARAGFQGLETDAQLTSDGHWVVIHDSRVDRTTNGTGSVMNMTLSQLRELDAGSWFDPYYSAEKIPTLDEYLRVCRVYGCTPHVELKDIERSYTDAEISSLASICKAAFPELNFVLYCFSNTLISRLRRLHRDIKLSYLTESFTTAAVDLCASLHPCELSVNRTGIPSDISYATSRGVYLSAWTIDYAMFADSLLKKGVRNLITNGWKP